MDEFFNTPSFRVGSSSDVLVNVSEDDLNVYVDIKAPGFKKEEIDIDVRDDVMTISGKTEFETKEEDKKKNYFMQEFKSESFQRVITLPSRVKAEGAKAKSEDGVIKVELQKADDAKSSKVVVE